jgi:hypothetical protein
MFICIEQKVISGSKNCVETALVAVYCKEGE